MLKVTEIAFSCYPVKDMKRSREFYEGVLGLETHGDFRRPVGRMTNSARIALAIGCAPGMFTPNPDGCMAALEVENFDDAIAHLNAARRQIPHGSDGVSALPHGDGF